MSVAGPADAGRRLTLDVAREADDARLRVRVGRGGERGRGMSLLGAVAGRAARRPRHRRARAAAPHSAARTRWPRQRCSSSRPTATCSSASASRRLRSRANGTARATPTGRSRRCASSSRWSASASRARPSPSTATSTRQALPLGLRLGERRPKIVIGRAERADAELAGEIADGVLLNYLPASLVPWSVEQVRAGGGRAIYAYVHSASPTATATPIRAPGPPQLRGRRRVRGPVPRARLRRRGRHFRNRWAARERDAALAAVGDAWVDEMQIMGDARTCATRCRRTSTRASTPDRVRAAVGRGPHRDREPDAPSPGLTSTASAPANLALPGPSSKNARRRWRASVANTSANASRSRSSPSASGPPRPSSIAAWRAHRDHGTPSRTAAQPRRVFLSPVATTRSTRPIASASSART